MPKIGGFRRQDPDKRDRQFSGLVLPPKLSNPSANVILPERTPIDDQGQAGSCTANASCDAFELIMADPVVQLSRLFTYWNARNMTGDAGRDEGCTLRNTFASFTNLGASPETWWPYDVRYVNERPALGAYEKAYDHKIKGYYAISEEYQPRLDQMERALRAGLPVVFGTDVGRQFETTDGTTVLEFPDASLGGHALVVVGFYETDSGERVWVIRNSWGTGWGDKGYCLFSSDYMTRPETCDLWVPLPLHYIE